MNNYIETLLSSNTPAIAFVLALGFIIMSIWSLVWKGLALWRASQLKQPGWFVILLIINSLGILEIIYLLVTNKQMPKKDKPAKNHDHAHDHTDHTGHNH